MNCSWRVRDYFISILLLMSEKEGYGFKYSKFWGISQHENCATTFYFQHTRNIWQFALTTLIPSSYYCMFHFQHDPVFINETADCQYHFSWQTPLACPVSKSVGSQCSVITPNFLMRFNLTGLQKPDYYKIQAGEYEFWLNVCKDISEVTGECQGVGSCQTKPSNHQMINAGV